MKILYMLACLSRWFLIYSLLSQQSAISNQKINPTHNRFPFSSACAQDFHEVVSGQCRQRILSGVNSERRPFGDSQQKIEVFGPFQVKLEAPVAVGRDLLLERFPNFQFQERSAVRWGRRGGRICRGKKHGCRDEWKKIFELCRDFDEILHFIE